MTRVVGNGIELQVADTGVGISNENLGRLFELFFTTKAPGKGTGQGLAITQAIVVRHGGTISVQSEVGHGTCFTVRLPVAGLPTSTEEPR
jgi:signal transduction histidine kinase